MKRFVVRNYRRLITLFRAVVLNKVAITAMHVGMSVCLAVYPPVTRCALSERSNIGSVRTCL